MQDLIDAHNVLAWVLIGTSAFAGTWSLAAQYLPVLRGKPLWVAIIIAQLVTIAQAIVGSILMGKYDLQPARLHALYGFTAVITVGILYSYRTSSWMKGKEYVLYGVGSLFIMGLGLRETLALT